MRDIKFKAYIKNLGWIVPLERINFDCKTVEVDLTNGQGDTSEYNFDEIELLEYTGLKDKNDKETYEDDIIKVKYAFSNKSYNFKVSRDDSNAGFLLKEITKSYGILEWFDNLSEPEFEVIGNIYENKELIE